ncbi:hypothetical protein D9M71_532250 [compost metagenome]
MQAVLDLFPQRRALERPLHGFVEHTLLVDALDAQAVDHVLVDGLGERVGLLEHHADPAAQLGNVFALAVDVVAVEVDRAFHAAAVNQVVHAVEGTQQGRLAAAGRADEGGHALLGDVHADIEQGLLVAVVQAQARHFDGYGFFSQAQALFVATQGRHVYTVRMGFMLHDFTPFVAASFSLQAASLSKSGL